MPNPRLLAMLTIFMMSAGVSGANAAYTLGQLQEVERLILAKNCGALMGYLVENVELLQGNDPLAVELRRFTQDVQGGLVDCLSVGPGLAGQAVDFAPNIAAAY